MKRLVFAVVSLLLLSLPAFGAEYRIPAEVYQDIEHILQAEGVSEAEICVGGDCETFYPVTVRKGGSAETAYQRPKNGADEGGAAGTISGILGQIGGKVGAGGRVTVNYEHEKKNKDGSSETTKVKVEITAGAGSAAAGAVEK